MDHKRHKCGDDRCGVCRGGLFDCEVCGGAEASLPSSCPGVRMTADEMDAIQAGRLDYTERGWIVQDLLGTWTLFPRG